MVSFDGGTDVGVWRGLGLRFDGLAFCIGMAPLSFIGIEER